MKKLHDLSIPTHLPRIDVAKSAKDKAIQSLHSTGKCINHISRSEVGRVVSIGTAGATIIVIGGLVGGAVGAAAGAGIGAAAVGAGAGPGALIGLAAGITIGSAAAVPLSDIAVKKVSKSSFFYKNRSKSGHDKGACNYNSDNDSGSDSDSDTATLGI